MCIGEGKTVSAIALFPRVKASQSVTSHHSELEEHFMQKLKRNINMGFRVTQEEYDLIMERMNEIGFPSLRSYLLKMALNGMIINLNLTDVRECSRLLRIVSNNLNQVAKRANETGNIYIVDIQDVQARLDEIWKQQDTIIRSLTKVLEVA
jgi:hypothetical protein